MTQEQVYSITPHDPLFIRDGRPFSADSSAQALSLPWPMPSTLAGAIRAHIGNLRGFVWRDNGVDRAKAINVHGPLLMAGKNSTDLKPYFHAPDDSFIYIDNTGKQCMMRLSPWDVKETCNLPHTSLRPLKFTKKTKQEKAYHFWSMEDMTKWLIGISSDIPKNRLNKLPEESRIHVKIDSEKGTSDTGMLYSTVSICFPDIPVYDTQEDQLISKILCRVQTIENLSGVDPAFFCFGGERRVSLLENSDSWPKIPQELLNAVTKSERLKLQLVTPALFKNGWKPEWLDANLEGCPPGISGITLKLISAAIDRKIPISGWDYDQRKGHGGTPKSARYAVHAGAVYFFEVKDGVLTPEIINSLWLHPVSDLAADGQDNRDGFGLVLPGIWNYAS